jgi:hypothetical protein
MSRRVLKSLAVAAGCALALGACASLKPKAKSGPTVVEALPPGPAEPAAKTPAPVVVKVPVPVREACVPKTLPRAPKYPDTDAALRDAGGAADRYQLMAAGRLLRERRLAELEKTVDGCR